MAWYNNSWVYRKSIAINASADGAQTNYQMPVKVYRSSGTDGAETINGQPGGKVYVSTLCEADYDDIRFTKSDGTSLLDYWIEYADADYAIIYVEFDSIPASGAGTFYMYYGNASATAVSSGANTFILFDDFERGNNGDAIGGSWSIHTGDVDISTEQKYGGTRAAKLIGAATRPSAYISCASSANIAIRTRIYKEDATDCYPFQHGDGTQRTALRIDASEDIYYLNSVPAWVDTGDNATADAWELYELRNFNYTAGTYDIYLNGASIQAAADMWTSADWSGLLNFQGDVVDTQDVYIDDVIVRKWTPNEPTFGTWGSQEKIEIVTLNVLAEATAAGIAPSEVFAGELVTLNVLAEAVASGIVPSWAGEWTLPHKLKLTASNNRTLVLKASNNRDLVLKAENNRTLVLKARD